jgi:hypothetical protein
VDGKKDLLMSEKGNHLLPSASTLVCVPAFHSLSHRPATMFEAQMSSQVSAQSPSSTFGSIKPVASNLAQARDILKSKLGLFL